MPSLSYFFVICSTPKARFHSYLFQIEHFKILVSFLGTASHLPYNRNGFKFFTNDGGLGKVDIKDILERAADIYHNFSDEGLREAGKKAAQSVKRVDYMAVYTSDLVAAVRKAAGNIGMPSNMHLYENYTAAL